MVQFSMLTEPAPTETPPPEASAKLLSNVQRMRLMIAPGESMPPPLPTAKLSPMVQSRKFSVPAVEGPRAETAPPFPPPESLLLNTQLVKVSVVALSPCCKRTAPPPEVPKPWLIATPQNLTTMPGPDSLNRPTLSLPETPNHAGPGPENVTLWEITGNEVAREIVPVAL